MSRRSAQARLYLGRPVFSTAIGPPLTGRQWSFFRSSGRRPVKARVCVDRNRITGGGVTAGIDFGLHLAAELAGRSTAERIQLSMEYNPEPPFRSGHPDMAPPEVVEAHQEMGKAMIEARRQAVARSAAKLGSLTPGRFD